MMKSIKITDDYFLLPHWNGLTNLRHGCNSIIGDAIYGSPTYKEACDQPTPEKIWMIYKLWKFHNNI